MGIVIQKCDCLPIGFPYTRHTLAIYLAVTMECVCLFTNICGGADTCDTQGLFFSHIYKEFPHFAYFCRRKLNRSRKDKQTNTSPSP